MSRYRYILSLADDPIRMAQLFMLCRMSGILLSTIIIARLVSLEEVGLIEMLMFCGYLVTFFWSDAIVKGFLSVASPERRMQEGSSLLWLSFFMGLLVMGLLVAGQRWLVPLLTHRPVLSGLSLFGVYQVFILPVWLAPFTGILKRHNMLLVCLYVLAGPAFACYVGFNSLSGFEGILVGLMCYAIVGCLWIMMTSTSISQMPWRSLFLRLWPVTWPLIFYSISTAVARSFDAWLVARHFDTSVFAVFRYGAREFPLVVALSAGLSTAMIGVLTQPAALPELKARSRRLMHLCYPWVIMLLLISPPAFAFVFGPGYRESAWIFNIYLLLTLTQLVFPQTVLTARGDTRILWYISLLELAVNIAASLILLQVMGLRGIVWGTWIAYVFEKCILFLVLRKRYQIAFRDIVPVPNLFVYAFAIGLAFLLSAWIFGA